MAKTWNDFIVCVAVMSLHLLTSGSLRAQCGPSDPAGHYEGTATSAQAGKLDLSLNLLCASGHYVGTLDASTGQYRVSDGSFKAGSLKLQVTQNDDNIAIDAKITGDALEGTFSTKDDNGPVALHRTGDARPMTADDDTLSLTPQQWKVDLDFLATELPKQHPDAFANTSKDKYDAAVSELAAKLDHLNADEIYIGLDHIANLIGDAHTYVEFPKNNANLPLDIRQFGNESRVRVVAAGYEQALGARVVAIQDTPTAKARELALAVTPIAETTALRDLRVDAMLTTGMALHGLGITPDRNAAQFTLTSDDGKQFVVNFKALPPGPEPKWINVSDALSEQPVSGNAACTFLDDAKTLYCNVRMILGLAEPSQKMFEALRSQHPDKVVIDLRENGGGDYNVGLKYLIEPLAKDAVINRKGHLFVLIGPNTFSAAMSNAAQFRTMTHATLVGETIGERPNSYQEPRQFELPNSHFIVRCSTKLYKFVDTGENVVVPDKEIIPTWFDYKNSHDAALAWILAFK
jgi:Peptidase family S41